MIINIANPIYDSVFKYLVEDERIAKTLLSALLKKEVVEVKVRRHEYTNGSRDNISLFRIDFGAQVKEADGSQHLVLIELQKTWLETETLRFRQYLATQYANPENIQKEHHRHGYAIPMVAVYLLGHRVGDIDEPIVYTKPVSSDYDGRPIVKGLPNSFIDSLTHSSIIVQIPLLHGQVNNRLEKVLSVFDQTAKNKYNRQVLCIDESKYAGDPDMEYIIHRLLTAASDAKLRQDMNVEEEYFAAIENRDTAIMHRDLKIAEQDVTILKQNERLSQQSEQLSQQSEQISQQSEQISQQSEQLSLKDTQLSQKDEQIAQQRQMVSQMIAGMQQSGMSLENIAKITSRSIEEIRELLKG